MRTVRKILILSSNPIMTPSLRLAEEVREIKEGLLRSKNRERFEIKSKLAVRLRDIRRSLLDFEPHIVHFTGHGKEDGLLVEDEMGMAARISTEALAGLFELCSDQVECIILSACYTESQASAIGDHINYVIGMKKAIKDKAAIEFAVGFYDALCVGEPVERAFKFGCNAVLQAFPGLPDYLIPILIKRKDRKVHNSDVIKIGKELINIKIVIEDTGDIFRAYVPLDARTREVREFLMGDIKVPKTLSKKNNTGCRLLSKNRHIIFDDSKTLRENNLQESETLTFVFEKKEKKVISTTTVIITLMFLIASFYVIKKTLFGDWNKLYITNLSFIDGVTKSPLSNALLKDNVNDAVIEGISRAKHFPMKYFSFKNEVPDNFKECLRGFLFNQNLTKREKIDNIISNIMIPLNINAIASVFYISNASSIIIRPFIIIKDKKNIVTENLEFLKSQLFCYDYITKEKRLCQLAKEKISTAIKTLIREMNLEHVHIRNFPLIQKKIFSSSDEKTYSFMEDKEEEELIKSLIMQSMYEVQKKIRPVQKLLINAPGHLIRNTEADVNDLANIFFDPNLGEKEKVRKIIKEIMIPHNVDVIVTGIYVENRNSAQVTIRPMLIVKYMEDIFYKNLQLKREEIGGNNSMTILKMWSKQGYFHITRAVQDMLEQVKNVSKK